MFKTFVMSAVLTVIAFLIAFGFIVVALIMSSVSGLAIGGYMLLASLGLFWFSVIMLVSFIVCELVGFFRDLHAHLKKS